MKSDPIRRGTGILCKAGKLFLLLMLLLSALLELKTVRAEETDEITSYYYPGNFGQDSSWGRPELHLKNGWSLDAKKYLPIYGVSGSAAYCIEMGVSYEAGSSRSSYDETYWEQYPAGLNPMLDSSAMKRTLGVLLHFGYRGKVSGVANNELCTMSREEICRWYATQLLVWETIGGYRDSQFAYLAPAAGEDEIRACVKPNHPARQEIFQYYDELVRKVSERLRLPELQDTLWSEVQTLPWEESMYHGSFSLSASLLANYSFSAAAPLTIHQTAEGLELQTGQALFSPVTITGTQKESSRAGLLVWGDGLVGPKDEGKQDLVMASGTVEDPIRLSFSVNTECGSLRIRKTVSGDLPLTGWRFRLKPQQEGPAGNYPETILTTDGDGLAELMLPAGQAFTVEEIGHVSLANHVYEVLGEKNRLFRIADSGGCEICFENRRRCGSITVLKTDSAGNVLPGAVLRLYRELPLDGAAELTYGGRIWYLVDEKTGSADGTLRFEALTAAENCGYLLEEYRAPEGAEPLKHYLELGSLPYAAGRLPAGYSGYYGEAEGKKLLYELPLILVNEQKPILPETGRKNAFLPVILGMPALTMCGMIVINRKRRGKK